MANSEHIQSLHEIPAEKTCSKCKLPKPIDEFSKHKSSKDGHQSACKSCATAYAKAWYEANREKIRAQQSEYRYANREKLNAASCAYQAANYDRVRAYRRKYNAENKETVKATQRKYRMKNKDALNASKKKYQSENLEKHRAKSAVHYAVKTGKLIKPCECSKCGKTCTPDAHHWSYLPEHQLNVAWLCRPCHWRVHAKD